MPSIAADEELLPLARAAAELPCRRGGKKTHVGTLYRWTTVGCRGIRLGYVQVGATRCTTRRMIAEFFEKLTAASQAGHGVGDGAMPTVTARQRTQAAVARELDALNI